MVLILSITNLKTTQSHQIPFAAEFVTTTTDQQRRQTWTGVGGGRTARPLMTDNGVLIREPASGATTKGTHLSVGTDRRFALDETETDTAEESAIKGD